MKEVILPASSQLPDCDLFNSKSFVVVVLKPKM